MNSTDRRLTDIEDKVAAIAPEPSAEPWPDDATDEQAWARLFAWLALGYCRERRSGGGGTATGQLLQAVLLEGMFDGLHYRHTEDNAIFWYVLMWWWRNPLVTQHCNEPTAEMCDIFERVWDEQWHPPMYEDERPVRSDDVVAGIGTLKEKPPQKWKQRGLPWWWEQFWTRVGV